MIYSDRLRTFLYALEGPRREGGYPFDALRSAAKKDGVPIIRPEMERFLQVLLELKKPQPPLAKAPVTDQIADLPKDFSVLDIDNDFLGIINRRKSHRVYTDETISLAELSYLLWCTQGVKEIRGKSYATLRTVPSGGARPPVPGVPWPSR